MILENIVSNFFSFLYYFVGNTKASLQGVKLGRGARISPQANIKRAGFIGNVVVAKNVVIGEGSYMNSGVILSGRIGKWCSIAYNVIIGPTEHNLNAYTTSPFLARKLKLEPNCTTKIVDEPIIEDEVWIGANVVVLKGVVIGRNAVIAAGAVVNKSVPPNEIWGGVPARFIKIRNNHFESSNLERSI